MLIEIYEIIDGVEQLYGQYNSDVIPRVGEKITNIFERWSFSVLSVEHIVQPKHGPVQSRQSQVVVVGQQVSIH